jgi:Mrp family chromosome partitioning ATPase
VAKADSRYLSVAFQHMPPPAPAAGVSQDLVVFHRPEHAVSAEYKALRDEIHDQLRVAGPKAIMFTSAVGHTGTTTVALNLAATLAQNLETRVLVIDAAGGTDNAAKKLAAAQSPGLAEVLTQKVPLAWSIQHTPIPRLHLLAGGEGHNASTETGKLITQLKQWFEWIVVDGGTWGARADREYLANASDGIYAVVRQSHVDSQEMNALKAALPATSNLKGYVTTRV